MSEGALFHKHYESPFECCYPHSFSFLGEFRIVANRNQHTHVHCNAPFHATLAGISTTHTKPHPRVSVDRCSSYKVNGEMLQPCDVQQTEQRPGDRRKRGCREKIRRVCVFSRVRVLPSPSTINPSFLFPKARAEATRGLLPACRKQASSCTDHHEAAKRFQEEEARRKNGRSPLTTYLPQDKPTPQGKTYGT